MTSLGIDCGQLKHSWCLVGEEGEVLGEGHFKEVRRELGKLRTAVEKHGLPKAVVMEATGSCWQNLRAELEGWGWTATAVDPQRAAQYARLHSPRHKTDKADARCLARLGLEGAQDSFSSGQPGALAAALARAVDQRTALVNQLHALVVVANPALIACKWKLGAPRSLAVLRAYPTTQKLQRARTLAKLRYGACCKVGEPAAHTLQQKSREMLCGAVNPAHPDQIRFLVDQIATWSAEIKRLEAELKALQPEAQILTSTPGVGQRTSLLVYARVPLATLASAKQAAAFVGLHPQLFQSGQACWAKLSKRGDAVARTALYRAALPASRCNPRLKAFYSRLRDRGKTHKQALCAVAHKLVRICYALVNNSSTYSTHYQPERY